MMEPLAYRMRPRTLEEVVGQQHLVGPGKIIARMVKARMLSSMILYGPPGTGKTSIASAIAGSTKYAFRKLNAATDSKKDLQVVAEEAKMSGTVILLLDEIHRLDKAKQDFLEDVEKRRAERDKSPLDDAKPKTLTVQVDGQAYRVTVAYGDIDLPASATDKITAPAGEGQEVAAPLEGKFFLTKNAQETPLKVGDKVKEGDLLCYIEAMKTYNAIRADFSGTVTAICVNPGDSVSEDDVLMKIG